MIWPVPSSEPGVDFDVYIIPIPVEGTRESVEVGATTAPSDMNVWGNTTGHTPAPSPVAPSIPPEVSVSIEIAIGMAQGIGELAVEIGRSLVLNALTFGGYGTYQMGKAMWDGYLEDGLPGALNAINPLYWIGRGAADTYIAAEKGDYRAATAAGVKTAAIAIATGATVAQGVGALTRGTGVGQGAGAAGASGAPLPSTLQRGPHAGQSIPARGPGRDFTPAETAEISRIGQTTGCHTCGTTSPGTRSGNFVPDHQPPSALNESGAPQRLYPHCLNCSRRQGGEVNAERARRRRE
jgi:hypothetical protein